MINYLKENPIDFSGLRILELGCGWGLIGVYLAKNYSCEVTCTDIDHKVLPIVDMHASLNKVLVHTKKASFCDLSQKELENFDILIGAEICYDDEVADQILELSKRAFVADVKKILIVDPGRPDFKHLSTRCVALFQSKTLQLPGSVNGKTTNLLTLQKFIH